MRKIRSLVRKTVYNGAEDGNKRDARGNVEPGWTARASDPGSRRRAPPRARRQLRASGCVRRGCLTYVDAVARHGSIRKAADALNVASSALNRQILDLEADLGSALFERLPRGVRLTAAGEVFLAYTRQAISELKAVESQVEQLRGLVRGQVSVAAVEVGRRANCCRLRSRSSRRRIQTSASIVRIGAPDELVSALVADQVDLILTHYSPPKKSVAIVAVATQALCALMVSDHPLASRDDLRLRDCLAYPLALGDVDPGGTRTDRAGAGTSLVRSRSAPRFQFGRDHEGIRPDESRRLLSIPQAG